MLGHEPHRFGVIDSRALYARTRAALARVGEDIDPRTPLRLLNPGQKQRVEIARALSLDCKVLLLDEPTATLSEADSGRLYDLMRELQQAGIAMVYISHRLREVLKVTNRLVCLRDGLRVAELATADATHDKLVTLLSGSTQAVPDAAPAPTGSVILSVRGRVSFDLRPGEILGLAGLVGAGRTSVLRELFGVRSTNLEITLRGRRMSFRSPRDAIDAGLALVPEERASEGLILDMQVERNIALPSLRRLWLEDELAIARPFMERFRIRGGGPARLLSGGNQQKIVLAKWMARKPAVLLLDEPTRGLDVGAKRDVHDVVRELAAAGAAVIVSSSEAEEVAALCHRALVLSHGQTRGELGRQDLTDANILRLAS